MRRLGAFRPEQSEGSEFAAGKGTLIPPPPPPERVLEGFESVGVNATARYTPIIPRRIRVKCYASYCATTPSYSSKNPRPEQKHGEETES